MGSKDRACWTSSDHPGSQWHNSDWIKSVADNKCLSELTIPGSHDTMTAHPDLPIADPWVKCQSWKLPLQLHMGLRFFDIRCRQIKDELPIYHRDFSLGCNFDDVLGEIDVYLENHSSECVIMNVQPQSNGENNTASFNDTVNRYLAKYSSRICTAAENGNPTVGDMRGKMVILARYKSTQPSLTWNQFIIENDWNNPGLANRKKYIRANLDKALTNKKSQLLLTFSSCTEYVEPISWIAETINPDVYSYVNSHPGRLGTILMDYPGPGLIRNIIAHNFDSLDTVCHKNNR